MSTFIDINQNTDEWMGLRRGRFTASTFGDLFSAKSTAKYQNAINKVVFERVTGTSPESFVNEYMERGHELEPHAREFYELTNLVKVTNGGFWTIGEHVGASPDGMVGKDGILEIKCPSYSVMINYLMDGRLPQQYVHQVQGQLYVTGRKWCDFVAYHPFLKVLTVRVERDKDIIKETEIKLKEAIETVNQRVQKYNEIDDR